MPDIPPPAAACLRAEFHEAMSMRCAECGYQPGPGSAATYLDRVVAGAERVQRTLCAYGGSIPCDCKYGGPSSRPGSEQTGCPELREAIGALRSIARVLSGEPVMTLTQWREYQEVMDRA